MSATPPFGPAYDEQPEDGPRSSPGQWRPRAGRPQGAQGGPNQGEPSQYQNGPYPPGGPQGGPNQGQPPGGRRQMPQAGRPSQNPRGGAPRAGGPSAGRGREPGPHQPPQHQSPQYSPQPGGYESQRPQSGPVTGSTPRTDQWGGGAPPARPEYRPQPGAPAEAEAPRKDEPFEEAAFVDDQVRDWDGGTETAAIGKLGYMPKEPRRRSDFQKVRSRARKSSPIPKIIIGVVVLALIGGGVWWFMNRPADEETATGGDASLTYAGSEEPCSLVDPAPLEAVVSGTEPESVASAEEKSRGWEQSCSMTYGEPERAAALLEVEGTVFDSDAKASVNFELVTGDIGEMGEAWTPVDPAPAVGDESAAVARVVEGGTSNFHLHVQDDNVYVVVRLSVAPDAALDEQGLTDLATELANAYLENWRDAS